MRRTGWLRAVRGAGERGEAGRDGSRALLYNHLVKIGLIGLAKSGKTTLFNLLTGASVATSRYDSGRAELHTGVARVPDPRVDRLAALFTPRKTTYATFDVVDLAGIDKGERAGLETKDFRNADALLHVVRGYADEALGAADPRRDIVDLETELLLADLEVVDRRLERLEASLRKQRKEAEVREQALLTRLKTELEAETPLRALALEPEDSRLARGFTFLSQKPIFHIVNVDEKSIPEGDRVVERFGLGEVAARPRTRVGWVSALIEAEVAQLGRDEEQAFLAELGLPEPAIRRVLRECYALLGLVSFFTVGEDEVRAWSIPEGTRAQDAAGAVHSDIARGFIRAEVASYDDLVAAGGSLADLRARGLLRLEGKDYVVRDGEVCHFRFNVGSR
jgi:GTP-binding protein YchF